MKPPIENVRVGRRGREQLLKLKRTARIEQWNILCRWAICASLREPAVPPALGAEGEMGLEMTWKVFAGEHSDLYSALLAMRWRKDTAKGEALDAGEHFRRHLHRGINFLEAKLESHDGVELLPQLAFEAAKGQRP